MWLLFQQWRMWPPGKATAVVRCGIHLLGHQSPSLPRIQCCPKTQVRGDACLWPHLRGPTPNVPFPMQSRVHGRGGKGKQLGCVHAPAQTPCCVSCSQAWGEKKTRHCVLGRGNQGHLLPVRTSEECLRIRASNLAFQAIIKAYLSR